MSEGACRGTSEGASHARLLLDTPNVFLQSDLRVSRAPPEVLACEVSPFTPSVVFHPTRLCQMCNVDPLPTPRVLKKCRIQSESKRIKAIQLIFLVCKLGETHLSCFEVIPYGAKW